MSFLLAFLLLQSSLTLRVNDPWGLPIAGAEVKVANSTLTTGDNGEVTLPNNLPGEFVIDVSKAGFDPIHKSFSQWNGTEVLEMKLGSVLAGVTVTATRTERMATDTASSVTILDSAAVETSPERAVDDMLKEVPGFSLLRRAGSVAAHPTSQGVSLRGVGASGASRTLVLADGIPISDAFGTWVYWNRIPRESIESIEVVRGGASDLYGSSAIGGVIHIKTRRPEEKTLRGEVSFGQRSLEEGSVFTSDVHGDWGYSFAGEAFDTAGYLSNFNPPVGGAAPQPGPVDQPVTSKYDTGVINIERKIGTGIRTYSNFEYSTEERNNGTPLTHNGTQFRQMILGAEIAHRYGQTEIQSYGGSEGFDSTFSSVSAGRKSETLTSTQHVPLGYGGIQGTTLLTLGRQNVVFGMEFHKARGISNELQFKSNTVTPIRNGGEQQTFAPFVEDLITLTPRANISISTRWDHWQNLDITNTKTVAARWSPKLAATYRLTSNFGLHAAGYGGFRAPTLNELYRPFSAGNVLTEPNPALGDERLRGGETGFDLQALQGRIHARVVGYEAWISGTIANITLSSSSTQTIQERENLGSTLSRGLETELELKPFRNISLVGSYLLIDASVTKYPSQVTLQGKRIPEVPRRQFSVMAQGTLLKDYRFNIQGRGGSLQYDDVPNLFPLDGYFTLDAYASRLLGRNLEAFVAGENLTNRAIQVTRTAVLLGLGMPRTVRAGLSVKFGAR